MLVAGVPPANVQFHDVGPLVDRSVNVTVSPIVTLVVLAPKLATIGCAVPVPIPLITIENACEPPDSDPS